MIDKDEGMAMELCIKMSMVIIAGIYEHVKRGHA